MELTIATAIIAAGMFVISLVNLVITLIDKMKK
ncbi:hypothetical protein J2S00_003283 [Caldalkalibacillus uzonensis]|uniref:Holin-like toxin n=1 Tax=Caldalkalibacillus uzonensis TaxID=353224 RepID=A0ABU0CVM7_9BACI|nr:hypothetical protein [Caldalkalibacillus uzonensis]